MKLFLAGAESNYAMALHAVQYPYRLCSYYYLKEPGLNDPMFRYMGDGAEWIMDSGLFTYMFGSEKGKLTSYADFEDYAKRYLEAVKEWSWQHTIVECDVQKVLGVKETHKLRRTLFEKSGLPVMYVWHIPEGEDGLRAMARRYDYIALSVPEFRQVPGHSKELLILRALRIIRDERGDDIKVHLLGNTENRLSRLPAASGDSTSWKGSGRWAKATMWDPKDRTPRVVSPYSPKWRTWVKISKEHHSQGFRFIETASSSDAEVQYLTDAAASAVCYRLFMEAINGRSEKPTKLFEQGTPSASTG